MELTPKQMRALRSAPVGSLGNRLADAIRIAKVSQADLSRAVGMSQQYVSDVARGRYPTITVENARKFAEFFECHIEDIFPAREAIAAEPLPDRRSIGTDASDRRKHRRFKTDHPASLEML